MTTEGAGARRAGSWKQIDLPVPVPESTKTSLPAAQADTTSRCSRFRGKQSVHEEDRAELMTKVHEKCSRREGVERGEGGGGARPATA